MHGGGIFGAAADKLKPAFGCNWGEAAAVYLCPTAAAVALSKKTARTKAGLGESNSKGYSDGAKLLS